MTSPYRYPGWKFVRRLISTHTSPSTSVAGSARTENGTRLRRYATAIGTENAMSVATSPVARPAKVARDWRSGPNAGSRKQYSSALKSRNSTMPSRLGQDHRVESDPRRSGHRVPERRRLPKRRRCWGRGHDLGEHRTFWEADDYGRQLASVQREVHGIPLRERAVRCEPGTVSSRISAARSREHRDHGAG